jgi:hypothetical protein
MLPAGSGTLGGHVRVRTARSVVTVALAAALCVAGTGSPAQAAGPPPRPDAVPTGPTASVVVFDWVSAAIAVYGLLRGGGDSDAAVRQVMAAVEAAKTEIINHVDLIASAEIQACVEAATIEFANIDFLPRTPLILWAQEATRCATLTTAFAQAVVSPQAIDQIGFLIGSIYAIVFAARARAGLPEGLNLILQNELLAYRQVSAKLGPGPGACVPFRIEGQIEYYTCRAYNGDTGRGYPGAVAWAIASRNISEPIAQDAIAKLIPVVNAG